MLIGYRVLSLAANEETAFTLTGVVETAIPGTYRVTGGASANVNVSVALRGWLE